MSSKKGVIAIQFNWIFILIAGVVILLFFFSIVQWQKKASESRINVAVLTNLETILTGAKITESSTNLVTIPQSEIGFDCNNYFIDLNKKQIKGKIIFAPNLIKGTRLLTHTLSWDVPFRVTNFLYLTSPQIRYVLVVDPTIPSSETLMLDVNKSLPPKFMKVGDKYELAMNKEIWNKADLDILEDENNYKVKFIFFNTGQTNAALNNLMNMPNADVTAIEVNQDPLYPNLGSINFSQKNRNQFQNNGKTYYLGKEAIIAAIFSEDVEMYNCSIKKAFKQLAITSEIYHNRSYDLGYHYGSYNPPCSSCHYQAAIKLKTISSNAKSISQGDDVVGNIKRLEKTEIPSLQKCNNNAQTYTCALIY